MQKKIKNLVLLSQTKGKLDGSKILTIAKTLGRKELALYYRMLYQKRHEEKVVVKTAIAAPGSLILRVRKIFAGQDIIFPKEPSLIAGLCVQFADFIFDASFQGYFSSIRKSYD
ncbi:hypothetical protein HYT17_02990 [Candidatus Microgenomates bacterium]|nr:hypothetical protein [Candidatus Microgenomates bacterium]